MGTWTRRGRLLERSIAYNSTADIDFTKRRSNDYVGNPTEATLIFWLHGTESHLIVTPMLWVKLIMYTFAAMALASLPLSETVMKYKPRSHESFIIGLSLAKRIINESGAFFLLLIGLVWVLSMTQ